MISGIISKVYGTYYEILPIDENKKIIDANHVLTARLRGKLRLKSKKGDRHLAFIGDYVLYSHPEPDEVQIEQLIPRQNALYRSNNFNAHCLGANLDRAILIVSLTAPKPKTGFIDRFLVSCSHSNIQPYLLFTKPDLLQSDELALMQELIASYSNLGYHCTTANLLDDNDPHLSEFLIKLQIGISLLCGYSGTGKSTLINKIIGGDVQKTADTSTSTGKGRHTTTNSTLFVDPVHQSALIDTPGVKEWGIDHLDLDAILNGFPETRQLYQNCQFHDCKHTQNSMGCKIQELIEASILAVEQADHLSLKNPALLSADRIYSLQKMIHNASILATRNIHSKHAGNKRN